MKNNTRRKELACGETREEAIANFCLIHEVIPWSNFTEVYDVEQDEVTGLWQVFRKRQDRTVKHPIKRESRTDFAHYHRKLVLIIEPGEMLSMRLKGQTSKRNLSIMWDDLYRILADLHAKAVIAARREARKAKKKGKK